MAIEMKQNWDIKLLGGSYISSQGSGQTAYSSTTDPEFRFFVTNSTLITNVSVKICEGNNNKHKVIMRTIKDNKIFYVSEELEPLHVPEEHSNVLSFSAQIPVTPDMGVFEVGYSPMAGAIMVHTVYEAPPHVDSGITFAVSPGATNAQVGDIAEVYSGHNYYYAAVKLELDGDSSSNDDEFNVTEKYQDENGNELKPYLVKTVAQGQDFTATAPSISGYKIIGYKVDAGALVTSNSVMLPAVDADHIIIFVYKKDDGSGGDPGDKNCCCCCTKVEIKISTCSTNQTLLSEINDALLRDGERTNCKCCK